MQHRAPLLRLLAGASLFLAGGCGMSERFVSIGSCDVTRSAAGVTSLDVQNRVGSIVVTPSSADEIAVTAAVSVRESLRQEFPAADAARDLRIVVDGDTLHVADAHKDERQSDFQLDLTISAPARLAWRLAIGVGNVDATAGGNAVDVTSGVGNVHVRGAVATLRASSGTGNLDADLETLSGGTLHCGTGNLALTLARGGITEKLACTTGTGLATVTVPASLSADVVVDTGTGHLSVEGAALEIRSSIVGGSASGRLGKGGPSLVVTTGTGNVRLRVRA